MKRPFRNSILAHISHRVSTATRVAALVAVVAWPSSWLPAASQEKTFEEIDKALPGELFWVTGKYMGLQDDQITLFDSPARFVVEDRRLLRDILALTAGKDNVSCLVSLRRAAAGGERAVFGVKTVKKAPEDSEVLMKSIALLKQRGPEGAADLLDLAKRIERMEKEFGRAELHTIARLACREALELDESILAPDDAAGRLGLVKKMHRRFADRDFTVALLTNLESRYPDHEPVRQALVALNCRKFRGRWMTYEDFKKMQGYVWFGDRWLLPRQAALLKTIHRFRMQATGDTIFRHRMSEEYRLLAQRGRVAIGMTPREVQEALGYPNMVFRKPMDDNLFSQWDYGGKYFYFVDDQLFKMPRAEKKKQRR